GGELVHSLLEPVAEDHGGLLLVVATAFDFAEQRVDRAEELGVRRTAGKIQVTNRFFEQRRHSCVGVGGERGHSCCSKGRIPSRLMSRSTFAHNRANECSLLARRAEFPLAGREGYAFAQSSSGV